MRVSQKTKKGYEMIITNKLCLPQPFVDAASSDYVYLPKRYSVTTVLNKGVMQMMLERRYADKITEDAADLVWAIFGTAVHSILENSKETDTQIKENKISVPVGNGYTISGIFDLYDDASGTVVDYKTTSAWKIVHNELDDYRMQILAYAWMLRQIGFDAKAGEVVIMLKDWSRSKALASHDYPQHPVFVKRWSFGPGDFDNIERIIRDRFELIAQCEIVDDEYLPECTPAERWSTPTTWAVMKPGRKSALRVFNDEQSAQELAALDPSYEIVVRPGRDVRCDSYCPCAEFCPRVKRIQKELEKSV